MDTIKNAEEIDRHRRRFFGAAAVTVAAAACVTWVHTPLFCV